MDFKKYLNKAAAELDKEVGKILEEQLSEVAKIDKKLTPLIKAFALSCQGGKRIRGVLVKLGYEIGKQSSVHPPAAGTGRQSSDILKIGAAYEIVHSAVLVHDDIIDQSIMRRDQPSLYQALGGKHYGISQAITLADYGFFLAFKIIANTSASELFSRIMMDTAFGQMLELRKANPLLVMKLKTACYTIAGPLQMGASLAGADQSLIGKLGEFGEALGIAFQIRDDILDSEIRSAERGKKETAEFKNRAMKVLPRITKDKIMSKLLEQMAEYLIERSE